MTEVEQELQLEDSAEAVVQHAEEPTPEPETLTPQELLDRLGAIDAAILVTWDADGDMRLTWRNARPPKFWAAAEYLKVVGTTMFHEGRAAQMQAQAELQAVRVSLAQDHLGKGGKVRN